MEMGQQSMKFLILLAGCLFLSPVLADENKTLGAYLGAKESIHPDWFKESFLDLEEDIAEAAELGKRLVLYFWQPGCPYCAELTQNNFGQRDISQMMQERFDLVALNMWGDREVVQIGGKLFTEKTLAEALRVSYTPTMIFFTEDRKVSLRLDGYVSPERYRLAMQYVTDQEESRISFRDYVAQNNPVSASGSIYKEPFSLKPPYDLSKLAGPIAIYFEQKQCSQCDNFHQRILTDPPTRDLAKGFHTVQLDMWSDQEIVTPAGKSTTARVWAEKLGISYAPSIVLFDRNGEEAMRVDAFLKTFHVQSVFDYVLTESHKQEPNFQRWISARAEHLREQGIDVDIWGY